MLISLYIKPVDIEIIAQFSGWELSQRDMSRMYNAHVSQGAMLQVPMVMWTPIEDDHIKEDRALCSMRINRFLTSSRVRVEITRSIRRCFFVCRVQRRLVEARYHSGYPDRCARVISDHHYHRPMLARRHQIWNHQYWSHMIFAGEFRVTLYHSDHPVSWMQQSTSLLKTWRKTWSQQLRL